MAALLRLVRIAGWVSLTASIAVAMGWLAWEVVQGPVEAQSVWPGPRLWRYFGNSIVLATAATVLAFCFALLPAAGLALARGPIWRRVLQGLVVVPLISMPSVFGYAWMLLCTSRIEAVRRFMDVCGFNSPDHELRGVSIVIAAWLWPIFALTLGACFQRLGRESYQLASLDAGPLRAFLRGVLPAMRAPLAAAASATFLLAMTDATIPPLVGASQVWSVEIMAGAAVAGKYDRSAAYVFWNAWPMLALAALVFAAAWPDIRRMSSWAVETASNDTGERSARSRWIGPVATGVAAMLALGPVALFCVELAGGRSGVWQAISIAWRTLGRVGLASTLVAGLTGAMGCAMGLAILHERDWPRWRILSARIALALTVVVAVLPPELSGVALVRFYSWTADPRTWGFTAGWNIYDDTPSTWIAALLCRFAFVAVLITLFMARRQGDDLDAQARAEGAGRLERLAVARLPGLYSTIAASALIIAGLSLSEVSVSVLTQPPRFIGGTLAAAIDAQMHYGRQDETIASALMLTVPTMLIALVVPSLMRPARRAALQATP